MKKDLYPHGSRELVDPKWSGAASKSNFARRDDGVPSRDFRAQGHGQADDAQAPRLLGLGATRSFSLAAATPREVPL